MTQIEKCFGQQVFTIYEAKMCWVFQHLLPRSGQKSMTAALSNNNWGHTQLSVNILHYERTLIKAGWPKTNQK